MKRQLLLAAACITAIFSVHAQVTTVAGLKTAIEGSTNESTTVTIGNTTLNFQTELNEETGEAYSITIPESVKELTIIGSSPDSKIIIKSQLLKLASNVDKIEIRDLFLTGGNATDHYILNLDTEDTTIGDILIDNCNLNTMRGIFRIKTDNINVSTLKINNCLISELGDYSVASLEKGKVTSIELTNNTIYSFSKAKEHKNLITSKDDVRITNFKMDHNTLNGVVKSSNYIADFGKSGGTATAISGDFIFTNNLLGAPYSDNTKAFSKVNYDTAVTGGNYISSSWTMSGVEKFFELISEGVYNLPVTAEELFPNAANNDFTLAKDQVYSNAGDPRWNVSTPDNIGKTETSNVVIITEYYTIAGIKLNAPQKGINLVKNIMEDGSVKTSKVILK